MHVSSPRRWAPAGPHATPADLAACRAAIRTGSRSFFAASLLLPQAVFSPAIALYAFCRMADDAIDAGAGGAPAALAGLHGRLQALYAGRPAPHPADRALADVVAEHAIPYALPAALLDGFAWDAEGRRYPDLAALEGYAARVAGTVGAMMALLMGVREREVLGRACDLGIAMQLSNIARDVGEDARAGRLYLPLDWLQEARVRPADILTRLHAPAVGDVVRRLLDRAAALYASADAGIARLPRRCRPGIRAARLLYAGIGEEVLRQGLAARAVVPRARKMRLLAHAWWAAGAAPEAPPAEAGRFLVEAVVAAPAPLTSPATLRQGFDARAAWLTALFARLAEQRT
jgi:phytoene synthase